MDKLASILITSRGRFDELLKAIESVINTAHNVDVVEIMLRLDDDDEDSLNRIKELPTDRIDINVMIGPRHKYIELYKYVNEMCAESKGKFLVWFNDDCVIESKNWDNIIAEYRGKLVCLYPNHKGTGSGNIFPIIHRKIYEILGHFALSQQVDSWQNMVCAKAGIVIRRNDLIFIHNRKQEYVSDENRMEVMRNTHKVWKNTAKAREKDIKKIKQYMEKQGMVPIENKTKKKKKKGKK